MIKCTLPTNEKTSKFTCNLDDLKLVLHFLTCKTDCISITDMLNVNHLEKLKQKPKLQTTIKAHIGKMLDEGDAMFKKIYYIIL